MAGINYGSHTERDYSAATETSLLIAFQIGLFTNPEEFRGEMDEFARRVAQLEPLEGFDRSYMAGGPEAEMEREYLKLGIPTGRNTHRNYGW